MLNIESTFPKIRSRLVRFLASAVLLTGMFVVTVQPAEATPGDISRVSVDSSNAQADQMSRFASISGDGRFVAFESDATNLVPGDTNGATDVFVRDTVTGTTTRVSVDSTGAQANGGSNYSAISSDGRFVAFVSDATNLVTGDTNNVIDVFVRDRQLGVTIRASVSSSGEQANDHSDSWLSISGDGRFVTFSSDATNLVVGDTNGMADIFVHDNQTGATERISIASDGSQANVGAFFPSISANGLFVVFTSVATNLVPADTNGRIDVFVRDRQAGITTRASVNSSGVEANQGGYDPSISGDGRYVSFSSASVNLIDEETSGFEYLYVHDRQTGSTTLASIHSDGYPMFGWTGQSDLSANGRFVAFQFDERGDGTGFHDIYVRDLFTGGTVSVTRGGSSEEDSSFLPAISDDGRFVAYSSIARNLIAGDTNGVRDVFRAEVQYPPDLNPGVLSVDLLCGSACSSFPSPAVISYRVLFSESVTGVGPEDFSVTTFGGVTGASIVEIRGLRNEYRIDVNTGTGEGSLRLDVVDNETILDISGNPLGGIGAGNGSFTTGAPFVIDKNIPFVTSISLTDGNPTASDFIHYAVTFSEPVSGLDAGDFNLPVTGGITGTSVVEVIGSGSTYSVTAATGSGDGTIRLDLVDNDSIVDQVNNPLGGPGAGNGNFTSSDTYTINKAAPIVSSILRSDSNPTAADPVHFTVVFSEPVSGVDPVDFVLTNTGGITNTAVLSVNGSGNTYIATIGTGSGNGTIRLDLVDNDSIVDTLGSPLGGTGAGNGNFAAGEVYTINKILLNTSTYTFSSNGANDGWVLESSEDSNQGGTKNVLDSVFRLGDDSQDRQYRAILHFPTYYLPDNAVVTEVILMIKAQGVAGINPFSTHGGISIDIRSGVFGSFGPFGINALQVSDFQNPASMNSAGLISNTPNNNWYWTTLNSAANPLVNLRGITQIRLAFQIDDNDNLGSDYLVFFSGNADLISERPHLVVKYYLP